jgi:flagellar hook-associated protein 3 FlgL
MRISTAQRYEAGIGTLQRRQQELADAQQKLTSGKRVERASDDPTAAARAERALARIERAGADQRALDASRHAMSLTEAALGDAGELLQQAREAVVAGGNGSYTDAERLALAEKLRGLRAELFAVANRSDGAGGHVFAGQGAADPPFVDAPGGVQWSGVPGAQQAASSDPMPLTVDGRAAWLGAPTGNSQFETRAQPGSSGAWIDGGRVSDPSALTGASYQIQFAVAGGATTYSVLKDGAPTALANLPYTSGGAITIEGVSVRVQGVPADGDGFEMLPSTPTLSVFDALDRAIGTLATPLQSRAAVAQGTVFALRDLDASMTRLGSTRAAVGEVLNRAASLAGRVADDELAAQTERANAEDLDMIHAISDFQSKQSGYDAALKSYAMVQRMSLLDQLR